MSVATTATSIMYQLCIQVECHYTCTGRFLGFVWASGPSEISSGIIATAQILITLDYFLNLVMYDSTYLLR